MVIGGADAGDPFKFAVQSSKNAIGGSSIDVSELTTVIGHTTNNIGQGPGIGFASGTAFGNLVGAAIAHELTETNSKGKLHFATKDTTGAGDDIPIRMTLDESGNLGIGTQSPANMLHLQGSTGASIFIDGSTGVDGIIFPDRTKLVSASGLGSIGETGPAGETGPSGIDGAAGAAGDVGEPGGYQMSFHWDPSITMVNPGTSGSIGEVRFDQLNASWNLVTQMAINNTAREGAGAPFFDSFSSGGMIRIFVAIVETASPTISEPDNFWLGRVTASVDQGGWRLLDVEYVNHNGDFSTLDDIISFQYVDPGPTGVQGIGADGADGPTGAVGPTGPSGIDGTIGETGSIGETGAAGSQGIKGGAAPSAYSNRITLLASDATAAELNPFSTDDTAVNAGTTGVEAVDVSYNQATGLWTINTAGVYDIACHWIMDSNAQPENDVHLSIRLNGNFDIFNEPYTVYRDPTIAPIQITTRILYECAAGDTVGFHADDMDVAPTSIHVEAGTSAVITRLANTISATDNYVCAVTSQNALEVTEEGNPFADSAYTGSGDVDLVSQNGITLNVVDGIFTVNADGLYSIDCNFLMDSAGGTQEDGAVFKIYVNDYVVYDNDYVSIYDIVATVSVVANITYELNAGDELKFTHTSKNDTGGGLNSIGSNVGTTANIYKIGGPAGPQGIPGSTGPAGPGGGVTAHNLLTGLDSDDHDQYALLSGRENQLLYGGTGASAYLQLASTSHATKGEVIIGEEGIASDQKVRITTRMNMDNADQTMIAAGSSIFINADDSTDDEGLGIGFGRSGSASPLIGAGIMYTREGSNGQGSLSFATKSSTTGDATIPFRMTIESDGDITLHGATTTISTFEAGGDILINPLGDLALGTVNSDNVTIGRSTSTVGVTIQSPNTPILMDGDIEMQNNHEIIFSPGHSGDWETGPTGVFQALNELGERTPRSGWSGSYTYEGVGTAPEDGGVTFGSPSQASTTALLVSKVMFGGGRSQEFFNHMRIGGFVTVLSRNNPDVRFWMAQIDDFIDVPATDDMFIVVKSPPIDSGENFLIGERVIVSYVETSPADPKTAYFTNPTSSDYFSLGFYPHESIVREIKGWTNDGTVTFNMYYTDKDDPGGTGIAISTTDIIADEPGATGVVIGNIPEDKWVFYRSSEVDDLQGTGVPVQMWLLYDAERPKGSDFG